LCHENGHDGHGGRGGGRGRGDRGGRGDVRALWHSHHLTEVRMSRMRVPSHTYSISESHHYMAVTEENMLYAHGCDYVCVHVHANESGNDYGCVRDRVHDGIQSAYELMYADFRFDSMISIGSQSIGTSDWAMTNANVNVHVHDGCLLLQKPAERMMKPYLLRLSN
jgi:hypothetical protein